VMRNNFLHLFFGWEAVGLVSYLLIGVWYKRPTAIFANMKAFLVNRVGDFGFILGIGLLLAYTGSMSYDGVFAQKDLLVQQVLPGTDWIWSQWPAFACSSARWVSLHNSHCTFGYQTQWKAQHQFLL